MHEHNRFGFVVAVLPPLVLAGKCLDINRALADDRRRPALETAQSQSKPRGKTIRARWNPSEALLFEVTTVSGS